MKRGFFIVLGLVFLGATWFGAPMFWFGPVKDPLRFALVHEIKYEPLAFWRSEDGN